jgi:hypothetical protein
MSTESKSEIRPKLYQAAQAGQPPRLILSKNRAGALSHAAKSAFVVTLADPIEAVKLGAAGVEIEDATLDTDSTDAGGEGGVP